MRRCPPPISKHQIPYVVVSHKNAETCKLSGKISYQRPDFEQVTAELISPTYTGFVARAVNATLSRPIGVMG